MMNNLHTFGNSIATAFGNGKSRLHASHCLVSEKFSFK